MWILAAFIALLAIGAVTHKTPSPTPPPGAAAPAPREPYSLHRDESCPPKSDVFCTQTDDIDQAP